MDTASKMPRHSKQILSGLWEIGQEDKANFDNPDDLFPTIYRIDRIHSFKVLDEHFRVPYKDRFEKGEFRKRVLFMCGGRLEHIKFRYTGPSIAVRLRYIDS